jgi:3beta-hydroxy-delta5-steroid dehydrogenase/steroid delta-isomerase
MVRPVDTDLLEGLDVSVGPRCLVTGGAGYLGEHLANALRQLGCSVRVLDVVPTDGDSVVGDVRDQALVRRAVEGMDVVFHTAAAMSFVGLASAATRERVFGVNVEGTRTVVEACRAAGVGRLVHTSTTNVCIDREIIEEDESAPYASSFVDLYGESKVLAEKLVLAADTSGGLRTVALRPGGIWGPGAGGFMIGAFLEQLVAGRMVASIGRGVAVADNTHVHSLVRAELLAAQVLGSMPDSVGGKPYFITDDERINGMEWFRPLAEGLGYRFPSLGLPGPLMYGIAWLGELAHLLGGSEPKLTRIGVLKLTRASSFRIDAARRDLGYAPMWTRDEGIAAHMDDYRALHDALEGGG